MKNYKFSTAFVALYLVVYSVLINTGASLDVISIMFALSPFLVIWMAYTILSIENLTAGSWKKMKNGVSQTKAGSISLSDNFYS